jgi:hypothetical protein
MDEPIRRKGEVWCVVIGSDRDWVRSDPETLVIHQKLTPGKNPKNFNQHYDHGGSLQLHILYTAF